MDLYSSKLIHVEKPIFNDRGKGGKGKNRKATKLQAAKRVFQDICVIFFRSASEGK